MHTHIKTDTQTIDDIFNQDTYDKLGEKWAPGATATPDTLPHTELALTQELALILKGKVVYLRSESRWYIWDGAEFIGTDGDFSVHKAIKHIANIYEAIIKVVIRDCAIDSKQEGHSKAFDKYSEHFSMNKKLQSMSSLTSLTTILKSELDEIPAGLVQETPFLTINHLKSRTTQIPFVTDFIPSVGIGQLYGASYTGKTLAMLDLSLSICAGLDTWMDKKLNVSGPSTVVYIAAEGGQPFWDAVAGWTQEHPEADLSGFMVLDSGAGQNVNVTGKEAAPGVYGLNNLKTQIKEAGIKPVLVVFDPQANILSGVDENSNSEMIAALTPIQKWANEENFLALLVHHAGKSDTGMGRGASAQMGMMDLLIKLDKNAAGIRTLRFDKVKGASQPEQRLNFRLNTVEIPTGSGKAAVVSPGETEFTGEEKSFMETNINRSKIVQLLKTGTTSASAMAKASDISRDKVSKILNDMQAQGITENIGTLTHPKWVLINPSDVDSVAD